MLKVGAILNICQRGYQCNKKQTLRGRYMKFRIIKYYDGYGVQVLDEDGKYKDIGLSHGYYSVEMAKDYCLAYKSQHEINVVEEFEL